MSSLRYGSSLIISSVVYAGLGFSLLSLMERPKVVEKKTEKVIKVAIITPVVPKVIAPAVVVPTPPVPIPPKKIEKPKPKKKIIKKPKPKKIVKKVKPKPKKVVKKVVPKPQPIIEEVYEEVYEEVAFVETPYVPTPAPARAVTQRAVQTPVASPPANLNAKKSKFLHKVRRTIHANKKYPKMAKRRNIQGTVHAVFDIQSNGTVSNIQLSGASSVLQKAVRKSILRSFPIDIPVELGSKFPMIAVSVNVDFVLE